MKKLSALLLTLLLLPCGAPARAEDGGRAFVKIHATGDSSYALRADGTVWRWGGDFLAPVLQSDSPGDFPDGMDDRDFPIPDDIVQFVYIDYMNVFEPYLFALRKDGAFGTLDGAELAFHAWEGITDVRGFAAVGGIATASRLSGMPVPIQQYTLLLVKQDGTVWRETLASPLARVEGLPEIAAVSLGWSHALALDKDGGVWSWGDNSAGQLGNGFSGTVRYPINVARVDGAVAVVARAGRTAVVRDDGTLLSWETADMQNRSTPYFAEGELRREPDPAAYEQPTNHGYLSGLPDLSISDMVWYDIPTGAVAPNAVVAVLTEDGELWMKGPGTLDFVRTEELDDVVSIKASAYEIYALRADGTIWCVGPRYLAAPNCERVGDIENVADFACAARRLLLLKRDGTVTVYGSSETALPQLDHIISVDAAYTARPAPYGEAVEYSNSYYCALRVDGTVWVWGENADGHLRGTGGDAPAQVVTARVIYRANDPTMVVDGIPHEIDPGRNTVPVFVDGRTLLPVRSLVERLGGTVDWDEVGGRVTVTLDGTVVELWLGKEEIFVNGEAKPIDVPAMAINDRTYLPLRAVAESLGFEVWWDSGTASVFLR